MPGSGIKLWVKIDIVSALKDFTGPWGDRHRVSNHVIRLESISKETPRCWLCHYCAAYYLLAGWLQTLYYHSCTISTAKCLYQFWATVLHVVSAQVSWKHSLHPLSPNCPHHPAGCCQHYCLCHSAETALGWRERHLSRDNTMSWRECKLWFGLTPKLHQWQNSLWYWA